VTTQAFQASPMMTKLTEGLESVVTLSQVPTIIRNSIASIKPLTKKLAALESLSKTNSLKTICLEQDSRLEQMRTAASTVSKVVTAKAIPLK